MFTLEQKVDLILRYIATTDRKQRTELKTALVKALESDAANAPVPETHDYDVDGAIFDMLKNLGMPRHLCGYEQVTCAIRLCLKDPSYLKEITKRLYPTVASMCDTTPSRVERAIRHAVTAVFDRGNLSYITEVFGYTVSPIKGKATNGEFIAGCVSEINRTLRG